MAVAGYERIAQALVDAGVDTVFGLMGDANLHVVMHLTQQHGVRFIGTRHEATAVSMADGYARATGGLGVCTVTRGPGLTNTLTALTSVGRARTPVVLLAGDVPSRPSNVRGLAHVQRVDEPAIGHVAGVDVVELREGNIYQAVVDALARAAEDWQPSLVLMPIDVQRAREPVIDLDYGRRQSRMTRLPNQDTIRAIASKLSQARRPVILAGRGAVRAGARDLLLEIGERTGALLATTLLAKDWFRGEPYNIGTSGGFSTPRAAGLLGEADVVFAVGASLSDYTTMFTTSLGEAEVIHVDAVASPIGMFMPVSMGVVGDAVATCEAVLDALPDERDGAGYRDERVAELIATENRWEDVGPPRSGYIDPRAVALKLDEMLPEDRTLVVDSGHHCGFASGYMRVQGPHRFMFALDFSSVGLGLGTALGAAVGDPKVLTVLAIGDGGLMMNFGDLHTAARLNLPLLVVVWNDEAFGAEVHSLRHKHMPDDIAFFPSPEFAQVAEDLGITGHRVTSVEELEVALKDFDPQAGPTLLDCRVDPDVIASWLREEQFLLSDLQE